MVTSGNLRRMSLERVEKVVFKVLNIHFDSSTPNVKLMQTMLAVVAEFFRKEGTFLQLFLSY